MPPCKCESRSLQMLDASIEQQMLSGCPMTCTFRQQNWGYAMEAQNKSHSPNLTFVWGLSFALNKCAEASTLQKWKLRSFQHCLRPFTKKILAKSPRKSWQSHQEILANDQENIAKVTKKILAKWPRKSCQSDQENLGKVTKKILAKWPRKSCQSDQENFAKVTKKILPKWPENLDKVIKKILAKLTRKIN